jgi:DNA repair protein RecO (recombination protein O)
MIWQGEAILLALRPYGEEKQIVSFLSAQEGRSKGLWRPPRHLPAKLQVGTHIWVEHQRRLDHQLGRLKIEPLKAHSHLVFEAPGPLLALASACSLLEILLPETAPQPALYASLHTLFGHLPGPFWAPSYVRWEVGLLAELGFGLDLERCAVTGVTARESHNDPLCYVSPRTGRAVCLSVGALYHQRLLPLPGFLGGAPGPSLWQEAAQGLHLTGHFLEHYALAQFGGAMPIWRVHLASLLDRHAGLA